MTGRPSPRGRPYTHGEDRCKGEGKVYTRGKIDFFGKILRETNIFKGKRNFVENLDSYRVRVSAEYENLKKIFEEGAPEQVQLLDNVFREAARIKIELEDMAVLVMKCGGRVSFNPKDPKQQKELPVSKVIERARASYANYMFRLSRALGVNIDENEDDGLSDYV